MFAQLDRLADNEEWYDFRSKPFRPGRSRGRHVNRETPLDEVFPYDESAPAQKDDA